MLNIILSALPVLGSLIPKGKTADIVAAGTKVAQEVFGTTDEKEIVSQLESNPALAEQFKAKLAAETAALQATLADTQDARATQVALAQIGHASAWGSPVMAMTVTVGFLAILSIFVLRPLQLDTIQITVVNVLIGYLGAGFQQAVNYYLGSSAGSAAKDAAIKQIATK